MSAADPAPRPDADDPPADPAAAPPANRPANRPANEPASAPASDSVANPGVPRVVWIGAAAVAVAAAIGAAMLWSVYNLESSRIGEPGDTFATEPDTRPVLMPGMAPPYVPPADAEPAEPSPSE